MLKWIITVALLGFALLYLGSLSYQQSLRACSVLDGQRALKGTYTKYLATGKIESDGSYKPYLFTNAVTVGGGQFRCAIAIAMPRFQDDGVLAMTTNQQFIFLGKDREPFMIPSSGQYRGPFFRRGF